MLLHNYWIVKIGKTVIVPEAVILPLVEGESGLTNICYSSQGINSIGESKMDAC